MRNCLLLLMIFLAGCTVRFPQVERLQAAFSEPSNPLDPILWQATIGDMKHELVAVIAADGGNIFVNKEGVILHYNAFIVNQIELFSETVRHVEYRDQETENGVERKVWVDYRPSNTWRCSTWRQVSPLKSQQHCQHDDGASYVNYRILNDQHQLIELQQGLGFKGLALHLKKKIT